MGTDLQLQGVQGQDPCSCISLCSAAASLGVLEGTGLPWHSIPGQTLAGIALVPLGLAGLTL